MSDCVCSNSIDSESETSDEPIQNLKDILSIKAVLEGNQRNLTLFTLGINSNILPQDIIKIKTGQVKPLSAGDALELTDEETGETRRYILNGKCIEAIRKLIEIEHPKDDDTLFQSQRGGPLSVASIDRMVKKWCEAIHLSGNYGVHTLRKTWGYHQYLTFKTCIQNISASLGHQSQEQTLDYLGITVKRIDDIFVNEL